MSNMKRKNEDDTNDDSKRLALDSEQLEQTLHDEEVSKTAPAIGKPDDEDNAEVKYDDEENDDDVNDETKHEDNGGETDQSSPDKQPAEDNQSSDQPPPSEQPEPEPKPQHKHDEVRQEPHVSREKEDPTFVSFRMYCLAKDASLIVGKRGEKINHIRDKANVKLQVSDNNKGSPERIVTVRGSSENVAKAFGLICRAIVDEPEDEASTLSSKSYDLRLLVPHPMVGFIIGKQGSNFRDIEENSAAKLKAAEKPLPYSTDRILSIKGVCDALHIAVYYVAQSWLEYKDCLKKSQIIFYNPANYDPSINPSSTLIGDLAQNKPNSGSIGNNNGPNQSNSPLNALNALSQMSSNRSPMNQHNQSPPQSMNAMHQPPQPPMNQMSPGMNNGMGMNSMSALNALSNLSNMMSPNNMGNNMNNNMGGPMGGNMNDMNNMNPMGGMGGPNMGGMNPNMNPMGNPNMNMMGNPNMNPLGNPGMNPAMGGGAPYGNRPYNFQGMFQPSISPQQGYAQNPSSGPNNQRSQAITAPPQQQITDEFGNNMIGEVLIYPPISVGGEKHNQDIYVANHSIGSVIGKGGNNIKQIRESSGCTYVKIEPDKGQTMQLGGGRGLVNMRKLTLTGSLTAINTAIYLINQRINTDNKRH